MANTSPGSPKVYTRQGDTGMTSLVEGKRITKDHLRIEAYGTIDELNSVIGLIQAELNQVHASAPAQIKLKNDFQGPLTQIQNQLFNIGSRLACTDIQILEKLPHVPASSIKEMEVWMDTMSVSLPRLQNFILPGGTRIASLFHLARTVARRAERAVVHIHQQETVEDVILQYLNRLSDTFFVCSRYANHCEGVVEPLWSHS